MKINLKASNIVHFCLLGSACIFLTTFLREILNLDSSVLTAGIATYIVITINSYLTSTNKEIKEEKKKD